jgi:hypothetical protein
MRACWPVFLVGVLLAGVATAEAQSPPATGARRPANRVRITLNGGAQTTRTAFTETRTFEAYQEEGTIRLDRNIPTGPVYGAGLSVRLWRGIAIGIDGSFFEDTGAGQVTARVPHPYYFDQHRVVSGDADGIDRREIAGHPYLALIVPIGRSIELTVSGGPSVFALEQVLATQVSYAQQYPYDAATFQGVTTERVRDTVLGYNAAVDLTWRFARHAGIGALVRFSRGEKDVRGTGEPVPIRTGGLHAGGGLRLVF